MTMAVKDATGATVNLEVPIGVNQKNMAGSKSVCIASDQTAFPININGTIIKAGGVKPDGTEPALVVTISPNSQNLNGNTTMALSSPVTIAKDQLAVPTISGGNQYGTITNGSLAMGTTGAIGDYFEAVLCVVTAVATSQVTITDNTVVITVLPNNVAGGIGSYYIPLGIKSINGQWHVTAGTGVTVIASGHFT